MLRLLGPAADTATGIDISREMLMLARSNLHAAGLDHLTVRQGNMYQLRFADGSFDTVSIDQVLYQAEQPADVLREAARVLKPGGRLLVVEYLTGEGVPDGLGPGEIPITGERLAGWLAEAGLDREARERVAARPWALVISVARRPEHEQAAAA
jgi:ArsR family transcriptional regulator